MQFGEVRSPYLAFVIRDAEYRPKAQARVFIITGMDGLLRVSLGLGRHTSVGWEPAKWLGTDNNMSLVQVCSRFHTRLMHRLISVPCDRGFHLHFHLQSGGKSHLLTIYFQE